MERKYFGTDGIRGVANKAPLDPETLVRLGKAVAKYFLGSKGHHRILIAKDTRLSGYMIETALASGITSMGADVLLCGPLPTPGAAYLTRSMRADAGIMISASHNPFEDNGIKIFADDGFKLPDEIEFELESLMIPKSLDAEHADPAHMGKARRIDDAVGRYLVYLKTCFPRELTLEGIKIGFDCANGAGYVVAPLVCEELGGFIETRGASPNGRNINSGFGSLFPEVVRELVIERNLDIGVSLDGDADRAVFVDEKGNVLDGDVVLALCAIDQEKRGLLKKNCIVATVMSNLGLEKMLEPYDIEVVRAPVGDRYVLEEMKKLGVELGGEQSGHTIFLEHATTGDGILSALRLLEIMAREQKSLSELASGFVRFPQKLINVKVKEKPDLMGIDEIRTVIEQKEQELKNTGRVVVRYSGTENKARVMVECESEDDCKRHAQDIAEVIERLLGTV